MRHPDDWLAISRAARRRVEEEFNVVRLNTRLVYYFEALLETPPEPPASDGRPIPLEAHV